MWNKTQVQQRRAQKKGKQREGNETKKKEQKKTNIKVVYHVSGSLLDGALTQ